MQYKHLDNIVKYPGLSALTHIKPVVKSLFFRGHYHPRLFANCAAVIGSRRMTQYGRQVIDKLVPQLVLQHKTIISGFMYGVDQYAHQVCIDAGGATIAVLGWGIAAPMDPADVILADKIINSGGLLLSEWQNQIGTLWTFPVRNRIVAGLSTEIYVIEAAQKSGSLLTADLGRKYHKNVFAVPGPITSKTSVGTNRLIQSGQAEMWLGQTVDQTPWINDPILKLLADEPLCTSDIARKLCQTVAQIAARVSTLELTNQISQHEGKYYLSICSSN
jgi:DNA processing protein